ncbi:hypothetical protein ROZALSC1DRAFT_30243, partial [Rozella allomycis CSF55]
MIREYRTETNASKLSFDFRRGSRQSITGSKISLTKTGSIARIRQSIMPDNVPQANIQVLDDQGNDVTPVSLIPKKKTQGMANSGSTDTKRSHSSIGVSKKAPTSKSQSTMSEDVEDSSSYTSYDDIQESREQIMGDKNQPAIQAKALTEKDLNMKINIILKETEDILLYDFQGYFVPPDSIEMDMAKAQNMRYQQILESRSRAVNLVERGMQTLPRLYKNKDTQATARKQINVESQVNEWSIFDVYEELAREENQKNADALEGDPLALNNAKSDSQGFKESGNMTEISEDLFASMDIDTVSEFASLMSTEATGNSVSAAPGAQTAQGKQLQMLMQAEIPKLSQFDQESLMESLRIMENAIVENNNFAKLFAYRNIKDPMEREISNESNNDLVDDNEEQAESKVVSDVNSLATHLPSLQNLWTFRCDLVKGRPVLGIAWNKKDSDILAVCYGEMNALIPGSSVHAKTKGVVLCWSLSNIEYPQRIYKKDSAAICVDFSSCNPYLLAAGFADGSIRIYDVRERHDEAVLDSSWIEREKLNGEENSQKESLISVSNDSRICQWMLRKGLEYSDLMVMRRISKAQT